MSREFMQSIGLKVRYIKMLQLFLHRINLTYDLMLTKYATSLNVIIYEIIIHYALDFMDYCGLCDIVISRRCDHGHFDDVVPGPVNATLGSCWSIVSFRRAIVCY